MSTCVSLSMQRSHVILQREDTSSRRHFSLSVTSSTRVTDVDAVCLHSPQGTNELILSPS